MPSDPDTLGDTETLATSLQSGQQRAKWAHSRPNADFLRALGLVDAPGAAELLGVDPQTLYIYQRQGLRSTKRGRLRLFYLVDIEAWLKGEMLPPRNRPRIKPLKRQQGGAS